MVIPGDYGPIKIVAGQHEGKIGYYHACEGDIAIVYFGVPNVIEPCKVRHSSMVKVRNFPELTRWAEQNTLVAKSLGVMWKRDERRGE